MKLHDLLAKLKIDSLNQGVSSGLNHWYSARQEKRFASINPTDGTEIATVLAADEDNYQTIIQKAQKAFTSWRQVPAPKRGELVRQMGLLLREKKSYLGSLVALEMGKSKQEGDGEVQEMIDMADFAVGQSRMLYGKTMPSERPSHRLYEQWHPYGIVGVITAFNFPVAVWAWNAFLAAICGNTVIWKPSSKVPLCAIAVQHLCNQVMQENGYEGIFNLFITHDKMLANKFVADEQISLISFTGSTPVGRHVGEKVAARLGRSILELGGNNAIIIDETANLDLVIPSIVFAAIGTAGQRCTSLRRLIIHESLYQQIIEKLIQAYRQVTIGDPLEEKNLMGPLIDEVAVDHYIKAVERIKALGGEIIFGGKALTREGFFVEPCLAKAENHWDIVQQETFAPILYLISYKTIEEAIALHNSVKQGLSSAIFTNNLQKAELFLSVSGSDCGIANVNVSTSGAEIGGAFGGEKETGGGRESGSDAWKAYMRRQTVTVNWGNELPLAQGIKFQVK